MYGGEGVEPLSEDNDNTSFYGCSDRFDVTLGTPVTGFPSGQPDYLLQLAPGGD